MPDNLVLDGVKICSIASGSNGNAYYVEYRDEAIVVDVGVSFRKFFQRMSSRGLDIRKIRAVLISHEHSDHVYGVKGLCHRYQVPAFMSRGTLKGLKIKYRPESGCIKLFETGDTLSVGNFKIHTFAKPHDVEDPCSFRVEVAGVNIGIMTDIGADCQELDTHLSQCHVAFLEANYDEKMLRDGSYPQELKHRIVSGRGHLSNIQSADIVRKLNPPKLHTILLSHISQENNKPELAMAAFEEFKSSRSIRVMSRHEASDLMLVTDSSCKSVPAQIEIPDRLDRPNLQLEFNFQ